MKNRLIRKKFQLNPVVLCLFFLGFVFNSCKDIGLEDITPSWLGGSIYEQLQDGYVDDKGNSHTFNTYIKLINEIGYADVLNKTGSKTVFVADDIAFDRFFKSNSWNVSSYEQLTIAQKRLILNSSMINNALLIENLSTIEGPVEGQALRRATALAVLDTIPVELGNDLPQNAYWDRFRTTGVRLAKDASAVPMLSFLESQMVAHSITDQDFSILFNGKSREKDDAYIYNDKVVARDITCQNGYIHILEDVLIPPSNMADVMRNASETKVFSSFVERYAAPYFHPGLTNQFRLAGGIDSVFVKGYFSERSATVPYSSTLKVCADPGMNFISSFLLFDPGWNLYSSSVTGSFQTDMGAIFAPSDEALNSYFTQGAGRALVDRYGSVENIPNNVLDKLIRNHMKSSFLASVPSQFSNIVDDAQEKMGVATSQIDKVYLASNGVVYVTNTVYPPALYSSVMFPAAINENMKVFNWAIEQLEFAPYLLSMVNTYSFLIPADNFTYIVPTSLKSPNPIAWKFHYNNTLKKVYASVHPYDNTKSYPSSIGDSISVELNVLVLKDHLEDMLDYHTIVGKIEGDKEYYRTKGGGTVRVTQNGAQLDFAGGGDIERKVSNTVTKIYDQSKETNGRGNGKSYVLDAPVQTPTRSVYSVLSDNVNYPQFSEFFKLLQGADDLWDGDKVRAAKYSVFYKDAAQAGLDYNVRFLNTYHYTLYVPTNDKVLEAINAGLPTWDEVAAETDQVERDKKADQIIRFLRYHFQDNAVFLDNPSISGSYQTATLNLNTEVFYKLKLNGGNNTLNITTGKGDVASVINTSGLYNIMARDFKFNTANPALATTIETSSYIVIHQIDKCLYFEGEYELLSSNKIQKMTRKKY